MPERSCDVCGKTKPLDGGKTCDNGHFVCKQCVHKNDNVFGSGPLKRCPIDKTPLK
jgi:hypothetical protein